VVSKQVLRHLISNILSPRSRALEKYRAFKCLLESNRASLQCMAEIEALSQSSLSFDFSRVIVKCQELSRRIEEMLSSLKQMSPKDHAALVSRFCEIDRDIRELTAFRDHDSGPPYLVPLNAVSAHSEKLVGGKAYRLGRLAQVLGCHVPEGFVISTNAYRSLCEHNNLADFVREQLAAVDIESPSSLEAVSRELQAALRLAELPAAVSAEIDNGVSQCVKSSDDYPLFAVRSSAVGEDVTACFAGQYCSELNVASENLKTAYKEVLASRFSPRALSYRIARGMLDSETRMAVLFMKMIDADFSGVLYTSDPISLRKRATVYAVRGLGESLVQGQSAPDVLEVPIGEGPEVVRRGGQQVFSLTGYESEESAVTRDSGEPTVPSISHDHVMKLADLAGKAEAFYGEPLDIEWSQDRRGNLFILQARPLQQAHPVNTEPRQQPDVGLHTIVLSGGETASSGIGAGTVAVIDTTADLDRVPAEAVLVAKAALPDYSKVLTRVCALVIDGGSVACHLASLARSFDIPMIVNAKAAATVLRDGAVVTVDGKTCSVYDGRIEGLLQGGGRKDRCTGSPFMTKVRSILDCISPLNLTDPFSPDFIPEGCRTFHDLIRYCHEKAIHTMFSIGQTGGKAHRGSKRLVSDLPILMHVVDLGGGLSDDASHHKEVSSPDIRSHLFQAFWKGISHKDIYWRDDILHLDWAELDRLSSGGIVGVTSSALSSFALLAADYVNLNIRFGFHMAVVDSFAGSRQEENHIRFSFKGGGGSADGKERRLAFLVGVLQTKGFRISAAGDLVDAQCNGIPSDDLLDNLQVIGSLLGVTRLLDMALQDDATVEEITGQFLRGQYDFKHLLKQPSEARKG